MGGSRIKFGRWALNILVVFVLSGIWHGAAWTYLIWGFSHGALHVLEKALRNRMPSMEKHSKFLKISVDALCVAKTFVLISLLFVMFRATGLGNMADMYAALFTQFGGGASLSIEPAIWIYLALFILSDVLFRDTRFDVWCEDKPMVVRWLVYALLIFMIVACSSVNSFPFIYFQF